MISRRAQTAMVVALLVAVVIAVVALVMKPEPRPPKGPPRPAGQLDSASEEPAGRLQYEAAPGGLILRIRTGSCHGGGSPTLELSDDKGWSFRTVRVPQVDDGTGVSALSRTVSVIAGVEVTARRHFVVWGADARCRLRSYETTDAGLDWKQGDLPLTQWHVDPKTGLVVSPVGPNGITCDGIATLDGFGDDGAVATCMDHSVHVSKDGKTFTSAPDLDKATTGVFFSSTKRGFSLVDDPDCRSRLYSTDDGGESWKKGGCFLEAVPIPAIGGSPELLVAGGTGAVLTSTDEGKTWKRPIDPNNDLEILRRRR